MKQQEIYQFKKLYRVTTGDKDGVGYTKVFDTKGEASIEISKAIHENNVENIWYSTELKMIDTREKKVIE